MEELLDMMAAMSHLPKSVIPLKTCCMQKQQKELMLDL